MRVPLNNREPDPVQILKFLEYAQKSYAKSPVVREATVKLLGGLGNNDLVGQIQRVTAYVRSNMLYVRDPANSEYVVSPVRLLEQISQQGYAAGDCDDHVMLLNSMLGSIGFQTHFVGVMFNTTERFNHVISAVQLNNRWQQIDPCAKSGNQRFYDQTLTI